MAMFAFDVEINLASDDESVDNVGLNESLENETQEVSLENESLSVDKIHEKAFSALSR